MKNTLIFLGFLVLGFVVTNVIVTSVHTTSPDTTTVISNIPTLNFDNKLNETKKNINNFELTQDRIIFINGAIAGNAESTANDIKKLYNDKKPIWLLINSPGGSVLDGALIISAMEASKSPVYTVCMQLCASMAAIIHQYGTKRYMVDRSILMFHDAAGGAQGPVPQMISRLKLINSYVTKMDAHVAKRSGQSLEQFTSKLANEVWLDAEDSFKQKYSDGIVSVLIKGYTVPAVITFDGDNKVDKFNIIWQ